MPTKRKRVTVNLLPADDAWLALYAMKMRRGLSEALQGLIATMRLRDEQRIDRHLTSRAIGFYQLDLLDFDADEPTPLDGACTTNTIAPRNDCTALSQDVSSRQQSAHQQ